MNQTKWLIQRAFLAVALMIGFYAFAIAISLALLLVPYGMWVYGGRVYVRIAAACIGGALAVLWALVPRRDRFEPPGPRLDESAQPRLFRLLRETAAGADQAMPTDVYLLNEVNAWVTHRGGVMGFGSRRVMGIGLPLLQALDVAELKAVIAHEFGHYASGDVKLGPWIYKTRAAIGRTIAGVRQTFLEAPFLWYGRAFVKLTHAVSRQQEFLADQVAAQVAGAGALISALRRITALTPMFSSYVRTEVVPCLQAGFLPPIAAGFDQYRRDDDVLAASERVIIATEHEDRTDEFDTHPSLHDRIEALNRLVNGVPAPHDTRPAFALIGNPEQLARSLVEHTFGQDAVKQLRSIDWNAVGESVYAAGWRHIVTSQTAFLSQLTTDGLPFGKKAFIQLGSRLVRSDEQNVNGDDRIARAVQLLSFAIAVQMLDSGWQARTSPGRPVVLVRDNDSFEPFGAVRALAEGTMTLADWTTRCQALGIAGRPLHAGTASLQT